MSPAWSLKREVLLGSNPWIAVRRDQRASRETGAVPQALALPPSPPCQTPPPPAPAFGGLGPVSVSSGLSQRTRHAESLAKTLEEYRTTTQVTHRRPHSPHFSFAVSGVCCLFLSPSVSFRVSTSCFYCLCCLTVCLPLSSLGLFTFPRSLPLSLSLSLSLCISVTQPLAFSGGEFSPQPPISLSLPGLFRFSSLHLPGSSLSVSWGDSPLCLWSLESLIPPVSLASL